MTGKAFNPPPPSGDQNQPIKLVLKDGKTFSGQSFGYRESVSGEVVFNTAMSGYPESLTDPSYKGQILVLTYPLIGNYGVPPMKEENGLKLFFESENIHIKGLVISEYSKESSHWNSWKTLSRWLIESQIPAIAGVDTRALAKYLRENGVMPGKLIFDNIDTEFVDSNQLNLVEQVSTREVKTYGNGRYTIVLVDLGVKQNIIRRLISRGATVITVPWNYNYLDMEYDGLFISNGPGNPEILTPTIEYLAAALKKDKPVFGICMGNQILALAAGGKIHKLLYGHRSHNQPVIMKDTNRCFITSQNHGYVTDISSLKDEWDDLFVNLNDNTNEGIRHRKKPFFSTQFHPEASSGPTDTDFLFDDFIEKVRKAKK
jgi:carbamoyl-phosphate synthase small subunit